MGWLGRLLSLRGALLVFVGLGVVTGGAFAAGILGVPSVVDVDNRFAGVTNQTTTIETDLTVSNPNPVGASLGDATVNYTVRMNGVGMATGGREGIAVERGNTTMTFTTAMRNERIPAWWYTHVDNGERTDVTVDAKATVPVLGGRSASLTQQKQVETDIVGQLDSNETKPVEAGAPLVSDPVLYINETSGGWGDNVTRQRTPIDVAFDVYNPKSYPYAISEIGYTIRMNGIPVGNGTTEDPASLPPREVTTVETTTAIDNQRLDEWWVSHLRNDQVTHLEIDFYAVIDPESAGLVGGPVEPFRIDLESVDYETTIETDIFGNKATGTAADDTDETSTATSTPTSTTGGETTDSDDGLLSGGETTTTNDPIIGGTTTDSPLLGDTEDSETETTASDGSTPTTESTPTETATPSDETTTTDDGGLLG